MLVGSCVTISVQRNNQYKCCRNMTKTHLSKLTLHFTSLLRMLRTPRRAHPRLLAWAVSRSTPTMRTMRRRTYQRQILRASFMQTKHRRISLHVPPRTHLGTNLNPRNALVALQISCRIRVASNMTMLSSMRLSAARETS